MHIKAHCLQVALLARQLETLLTNPSQQGYMPAKAKSIKCRHDIKEMSISAHTYGHSDLYAP